MVQRRVRLWLPLGGLRLRILAVVAVALTAAVVGLLVFAVSRSSASGSTNRAPASGLATVGTTAPPFAAPSINPAEPPVRSSSFRNSPVLLNFFASWCHPCKQELPLLAKAAARHPFGVRFVGVDVNDSDADARRLLKTAGVTYPIAADPSDTITQRYGLTSLPTTFMIGADGRITHVHSGPLTTKILDGWLNSLTGSAHS